MSERAANASSKGMRLSGTNLERAGDHNQRVTLHAIRVNGPITRAELAAITGLTAPAIANITKRLLTDKLIQEAGRRRGGRGQPATKLVINPDSWFSIGLNVDRDHITWWCWISKGRCARAPRARWLSRCRGTSSSSSARASANYSPRWASAASGWWASAWRCPTTCRGRRRCRTSRPTTAVWASTDVASLLESARCSVPVFVENDAAAATMGEMQFGLGKKHQTFFYILITAALGGSLVIDGNHFRGATGRSRRARAAARPRRQRATSARSRTSSRCRRSTAGSPRRASVCPRRPSSRDLDESGQAIIDAWVEAAVDSLLDTLLAINCLVNPEAILIGGRLPAGIVDRLATRLNQRLEAHAGTVPAIAPVARAALSDDAPAVGAAILPFSHRLLPTRTALMKVAAL